METTEYALSKFIDLLKKKDIEARIHKEILIEGLEELDYMVGLPQAKNKVIQFVCENLIEPMDIGIGNHFMIVGSAGVGKSSLIEILAKIMFALGLTGKTKSSPVPGPNTFIPDSEKEIIHRTAGIQFVRDQISYIREDIKALEVPSLNAIGPTNDPNVLTRLAWIEQISNEIYEVGKPTLVKHGYIRDGENPPKVRPHIVRITRDEIIGKFQGESAKNMRAAFERAKGGILLIDEAYSLINSERDGSDSFGNECLDILNKLMERTDVTVVLAGYEDQIEKRLFSAQSGLKSRIGYTFKIEAPSVEDLTVMMQRRLENKTDLTFNELKNLVETINKEGYGRTIAKWCKEAAGICATRRFFDPSGCPKICKDDLIQSRDNLKLNKTNEMVDSFMYV